MAYIFLFIAFTLNASANVLLKLAATNGFSFVGTVRGEWSWATLYAASATGLFFLNLCFYLLALGRIPLSIAYPIMIGMTFVITTGAAVFLGERMSLVHALGLALIFLGVVIVVRANA